MTRKKRFLVSMSELMLKAIDELIENGFYETRNEFIREISRKYLIDNNMIGFNMETEP